MKKGMETGSIRMQDRIVVLIVRVLEKARMEVRVNIVWLRCLFARSRSRRGPQFNNSWRKHQGDPEVGGREQWPGPR